MYLLSKIKIKKCFVTLIFYVWWLLQIDDMSENLKPAVPAAPQTAGRSSSTFSVSPDEELQLGEYKYHHDFLATRGRFLRLAVKTYRNGDDSIAIYIHLVIFKYNPDQSVWLRRSHMALTIDEFYAFEGFLRQPPIRFNDVLLDVGVARDILPFTINHAMNH